MDLLRCLPFGLFSVWRGDDDSFCFDETLNGGDLTASDDLTLPKDDLSLADSKIDDLISVTRSVSLSDATLPTRLAEENISLPYADFGSSEEMARSIRGMSLTLDKSVDSSFMDNTLIDNDNSVVDGTIIENGTGNNTLTAEKDFFGNGCFDDAIEDDSFLSRADDTFHGMATTTFTDVSQLSAFSLPSAASSSASDESDAEKLVTFV